MFNNITRNLVNNFTPRKAERARSDSGQVQPHILRTALVVFTLALLSACGGEPMEPTDAAVDNPTDGEEWCRNALTIDDFQDGNLAAESLGGTWSATPTGLSIVAGATGLEVNGAPGPDGNILIELNLASPVNVRENDTLFAEVEVGYLHHPLPFEGQFEIVMEGEGITGPCRTSKESEMWDFGTPYLVYNMDLIDPNLSIHTLSKIGFKVYSTNPEVPSTADLYVRIKKAWLCRTNWEPEYNF